VEETKATRKLWAEVTTKGAVIPLETTERRDREEEVGEREMRRQTLKKNPTPSPRSGISPQHKV
jgi:hypothetical protein